MTSLTVPSEYAWVIFVAGMAAFHVVATGFVVSGVFLCSKRTQFIGLRGKLFTRDFFLKRFDGKFNDSNIPLLGYPDMGHGRYSAKLTDEEWLMFNNCQRAHQNYVEGIASAIFLILASGFFYPRVGAGFGLIYIIGREMYARGYRRSGAVGRKAGAALFDQALIIMFVTTMVGAFNAAGGLHGLARFCGLSA